MTAVHATAPTPMPTALHPPFCSPRLCKDRGADINHRETPEPFLTLDEPVSVALIQNDERCEDRQIAYQPEVQLMVGPTITELNADQAEELGHRLIAVAHRARTRAPRDVSAA